MGQHGKTFLNTDDTTPEANLLTIAPQTGGRVIAVMAAETGHLVPGDMWFSIDSTASQATVSMAQAHLDRALLNATSTGSDVGAAAASVASTEVTLQQTQGYLARGRTLARAGQISQMAVDHAQTIVDKAVAARSCV